MLAIIFVLIVNQMAVIPLNPSMIIASASPILYSMLGQLKAIICVAIPVALCYNKVERQGEILMQVQNEGQGRIGEYAAQSFDFAYRFVFKCRGAK